MFQRTKIRSGLLLAIGSGAFALSGSVHAQDDTGVQRVEIIGSSIKRIDSESDAPITTLTREDIARTGATTVEELMRHIPAADSSNSTSAASASGATTGGISTISLHGLGPDHTLILINGQRSVPFGSPADSVSVDLDSIPIAAIERVEVLKEGASAIYGSDAVAGVVNFVLRKDYSGVELSAYHGAAYDGKGPVSKGSLTMGVNVARGNATLILTTEHDSAMYGRDRAFANSTIHPEHDNVSASSASVPANINIPNISGTFNPAVPVHYDATANVDPSTGLPAGGFAANGATSCGPVSTYSPLFAPTACLFDPAGYTSLVPDVKRYGALFSGHYDLSDDVRLHLDLSLTNKKAFTSIQPAPLGSFVNIPYTMTTANPYYPTAFVTGITTAATAAGQYTGSLTPDLVLRYRPFLTGERNLTDDATNTRASFGAEGTFAGWDYSSNLLYSASQVKETLQSGYYRIDGGTASGGPGIEALLNGQDMDANGNTLWVNPFGDNGAAVNAAALATNFVGTAFKTTASLVDGQFKLSKDDVYKLPGGNVGAAFGVEIHRDEYKLAAASALASGDIAGYGGNFPNFDRSRNVASLFGELDVPVVKGFDIDGAVRYDRYGATTNPNTLAAGMTTLGSIQPQAVNGDVLTLPGSLVSTVAQQSTQSATSFGQTTGKLGAKWVASKQILLRSTVSTGFRAPSLLDLYAPLQSGISTYVNDPKRCTDPRDGQVDCGTQFNTYNGGRGDLKPERSLTWTLGTVMEPVKDTTFSVDYFHTKLRNEITQLSAAYLLSHEAQYADRISRGPADGVGTAGPIIAVDQRQENIAEAIVSGIDFDFSTALRTSSGRYGFALGGTWMTRWDSVNPDGSTVSSIGQTSAAVTGMVPRVKLSTVLSYATPQGMFAGSAIYNWQSAGHDICGSLDQDDVGNCAAGFSPPRVASYGTTDLQGVWNPTRKFSATLGVKNAFNTTPPYVNGAGGAFQSGYDPTYVDPHGRFWYASGTVRF